jgi:hypothetical protein
MQMRRALTGHLQKNMGDQEFQESQDLINELMRCCSQGDDGGELDEQAQDDPAFAGRHPTPGGKIVGDRERVTPAAARSFSRLFPGAKPVAHV